MFGLGLFELFVLFIVFGPFIINFRLARSRGKDVVLMLFLTIIFSWIVTLILAFLPEKEHPETDSPAEIEKYFNLNVNSAKKIEEYSKEELGEAVNCPFCKQLTYSGLIQCRWCGNLIDDLMPNHP
jgi:hypothetical protein